MHICFSHLYPYFRYYFRYTLLLDSIFYYYPNTTISNSVFSPSHHCFYMAGWSTNLSAACGVAQQRHDTKSPTNNLHSTKRHPHNCMSIKTGPKTCKIEDQISKKIAVFWRAVLSSSFICNPHEIIAVFHLSRFLFICIPAFHQTPKICIAGPFSCSFSLFCTLPHLHSLFFTPVICFFARNRTVLHYFRPPWAVCITRANSSCQGEKL